MDRGPYNGYRGRSGLQKVLLGLVSVLAVLVVGMILAMLLGQRYIYYGADGVHLDLPFMTREPAPAPDVDHVVIEVLPPAPSEPDASQQEGEFVQPEAELTDGSAPAEQEGQSE